MSEDEFRIAKRLTIENQDKITELEKNIGVNPNILFDTSFYNWNDDLDKRIEKLEKKPCMQITEIFTPSEVRLMKLVSKTIGEHTKEISELKKQAAGSCNVLSAQIDELKEQVVAWIDDIRIGNKQRTKLEEQCKIGEKNIFKRINKLEGETMPYVNGQDKLGGERTVNSEGCKSIRASLEDTDSKPPSSRFMDSVPYKEAIAKLENPSEQDLKEAFKQGRQGGGDVYLGFEKEVADPIAKHIQNKWQEHYNHSARQTEIDDHFRQHKELQDKGIYHSKVIHVEKEDLEKLLEYAEYKADDMETGSKYDYNWWLKCQEKYRPEDK